MYQIIPMRKGSISDDLDFIFADFKSFYEVANSITVKFESKYKVGIKSDNYKDIKEFITKADNYSHLSVFLYIPPELVDYISLYNSDANVASEIRPIDTLKELASKESLLFAKGVIYKLYNSILHDNDSLEEAIQILLKEFGRQNEITEQMLSTVFAVNNLVYPRQVLLAYLWMDRYRESKLKSCLSYFGNDICIGAMIKNLNQLMQDKAKLYSTGTGSQLVKTISSTNLLQMYKVLVIERKKFSDITILLHLYEKGLSTYDYIKK